MCIILLSSAIVGNITLGKFFEIVFDSTLLKYIYICTYISKHISVCLLVSETSLHRERNIYVILCSVFLVVLLVEVINNNAA